MTRDGVSYIKALLDADHTSAAYAIGWKVWMMSESSEILDYLTDMMTLHRPGTRAWEVAYEIWLLTGARGVAA